MPPSHFQVVAATGAIGLAYLMHHRFSAEAQMHRAITAFSEQLRKEHASYPTFTIDRTLDADCMGRRLSIGVSPTGQGIRHGDGKPIHTLREFKKDGATLNYDFSEETKLRIEKRPDGSIFYSYESPTAEVAKTMDPILVANFKTISMNSAELDAIAQLR